MATNSGPSSPIEVGEEWATLLRMLPGYDPFAAPGGAWFDTAAAEKVLRFFPTCLRHVEGGLAGQPFALSRWQESWMANLFGWKQRDAMGRVVRRYRECLGYQPRKQGKTPVASGVALYVFFCDDEAGQQDFIAAADREQAGMLFRHAKGMVDANPDMAKRCRVYGGNASAGQSRSLVKPDGSFLRVVSADADTKHGGNSHLILIDELHAQPNRELVDVLTTSTASLNRAQPLTIYITTADYMRPSICNEKYEYAKQVCQTPEIDPRFLPVIYEADAADDWTAPATWEKANPNLGVSVSLEYLERECERAKTSPEYENTFKRLHLNLRTDSDVRWLSSLAWDACAGPVDPATLKYRRCFAGLDLANSQDMVALVLVFPPADSEPWAVVPYFWVPEAAARDRERANRVRYDAWISKGHIARTPGDVTDYTVVKSKILSLHAEYRIEVLAYDPYNATHLAAELVNEGVECKSFAQTLLNYNEPCLKLESLLADRRLAHGGNPVLRWMAGNVSLHTDGRGYKMPSRKRSVDKIDGIAALVMGLAVGEQAGDDWYTPGMLSN